MCSLPLVKRRHLSITLHVSTSSRNSVKVLSKTFQYK